MQFKWALLRFFLKNKPPEHWALAITVTWRHHTWQCFLPNIQAEATIPCQTSKDINYTPLFWVFLATGPEINIPLTIFLYTIYCSGIFHGYFLNFSPVSFLLRSWRGKKSGKAVGMFPINFDWYAFLFLSNKIIPSHSQWFFVH